MTQHLNRKLDFTNDAGGIETHRLLQLYGPSPFLAVATPGTKIAGDLMPGVDVQAGAFADPVDRQFPCHTPAATWLSAVFFTEKRAELAPERATTIERQFEKFAGIFGITETLATIGQRYAELHPDPQVAQAKLADDHFGFIWKDEFGKQHRELRMCSALETKQAAQWFAGNRSQFPRLTTRREVAQRILEKTAAFGAMLNPADNHLLQRCAGYGVPDIHALDAAIGQRAALATAPDAKLAMVALAETLIQNPYTLGDPAVLTKLADMLDDFDHEQLKLSPADYGNLLKQAEDVVFEVAYDQGQQALDAAVPLANGTVIDKAAFDALTLQDVQDLFGSGTSGAVADGLDLDKSKFAAMVSKMAAEDATALEALLRSKGAQAMYRGSGPAKHLAGDAAEALAASYR
jgi:hypothetical protein